MRRLYHKILFITTKSGYKQQIKVLENKKAPSLLMLLCSRMERAMGIEPTSRAWEARILPMNYARNFWKPDKV